MMLVTFNSKNQNGLIINKLLFKIKINGDRNDSGISL